MAGLEEKQEVAKELRFHNLRLQVEHREKILITPKIKREPSEEKTSA
jgi:hypothetical protein